MNIPTKYEPIKPAASHLLQERWDQDQYQQHINLKSTTGAMVDSSEPKRYGHLERKAKKEMMEDDRRKQIESDNKNLLEKMAKIMRTKSQIDNLQDVKFKSLNRGKKERELLRIDRENLNILRRMREAKPFYSRKKMLKSFDKHCEYRDNLNKRSRNVVVKTISRSQSVKSYSKHEEE
ncbi:hypothetical protein SNEBB_008685 [Seison nebaliae]|nr:hypothetical protein SNEBB_008685 [Seison nebaliae]